MGGSVQYMAGEATQRLRDLRESYVEVMRSRCALLPAEQQRLMELVFSGRSSLRQIAVLLGQNPGALSRRVRAIKTRLLSPISAALAERGSELAEQYLHSGILYFLHGLPVAQICRKLDMPRREALAILEYIRGWSAMRQRRVG